VFLSSWRCAFSTNRSISTVQRTKVNSTSKSNGRIHYPVVDKRGSIMPKPRLYEPPIRVRLPREQLAHLRRLSKASGLPVQQLVRICVGRALPYAEAFVRKALTKKGEG